MQNQLNKVIYEISIFLKDSIENTYVFLEKNNVVYYYGKLFDFLEKNQLLFSLIFLVLIYILLFLRQLEKLAKHIIKARKNIIISNNLPRVLNGGSERKILILGDSTAYGTGTNIIENTLAGRFAKDFPKVEINNYAVNGSNTEDVLKQIENVKNKEYNLTIISTGGNDTWKFTNIKKIEKAINEIIIKTKKISQNNVILIIYNNKASAPIFPLFLRRRIVKRTEIINKLFIKTAEDNNIDYVTIFKEDEHCPYNFFAEDYLHPSSEGYKIMYLRLWSVLSKNVQKYNLR